MADKRERERKLREKHLVPTIRILTKELKAIGKNGHIELGHLHLKAYMRVTNRWSPIKKNFVETIEIGSVDVEEEYQRRGYFKLFLEALEHIARAKARYVFIENVQNEHLVNYFDLKRSWTYIKDMTGEIPCYWKKDYK